MTIKAFTFGAVVLTAMSAAAQDKVPSIPSQQEKMVIELRGQLAAARVPIEGKIVTGAPYSAEVVTESVQVLADGNRIVHRATGRVYRDAQGRMRRETDKEPGQVEGVSITDPVAGISYSLDPTTRTAWKTSADVAGAIVRKIELADPGDVERKRQIEAELAQALRAGAAATVPHSAVQHSVDHATVSGAPIGAPEQKVEKLPARNIEGVMAEGTRTTWTIPAGAIGNEQPIVTITELWRSPELQVMVMTRTTDPRTGESTYKLQNIVRGEQSRTWFDVPADYTVKESGIRKLAPAVK